MANRRCFSETVIEADKFLMMKPKLQALYIHLCMNGDDDGFVDNVESVRKSCNCKPTDINDLVREGYIISFDNGVIVITDWRIHNTLQNDRYHPTVYQDLFKTLEKDEKTRKYKVNSKLRTQEFTTVEDLKHENVSITKHNKHNVTNTTQQEGNATKENETEDNDIIAEYGSYLEEQAKSIFGSSGFVDRKQYQHRQSDVDPISSGDY